MQDTPPLVKEGTGEVSFSLEPKFDGISIELIYQDGKFHKAYTRGDGTVGDDVTHNIKTIKNIPRKLAGDSSTYQWTYFFRGEVMMPKSERKRLNQEREQTGENLFANTRNAASGTMKLLDSNEVKQRKLICYVYDCLGIEDSKWNHVQPSRSRHDELYDFFEQTWLPYYEKPIINESIEEIITYCEDEHTVQKYLEQDIDFDGLVVKVNDYTIRTIVGQTNHHPRRAIAYKFPAQQIATQIESVEFQIGRTGILTPVAHLTPVHLSWVTISRVSLHNMDFITNKDIHLHDRVFVQRSGEVIPYIVSVIKDKREEWVQQPINPPTHCLSCGSAIHQEDIHYYCINPSCPAQIKEKITHFVSKQCMNIDGLGSQIIDILVDQQIITSVVDLYWLHTQRMKLLSLPWFAHKKVDHLIQQIEQSKYNEFRRILNGLWVPNIGKKTAQVLQHEIHQKLSNDNTAIDLSSIIKLLNTIEFLEPIYWIGKKVAAGVSEFVTNNKSLFTWLAEQWVAFTHMGKSSNNSGWEWTFAWQHFSMTGTFPVSRDDLVDFLESQGAIFDSSPTKQTDFMLIGEKPWSKKAKAQKMDIPLYEWRESVQVHIQRVWWSLKKTTESSPMQWSLFG